MAVEKSSAAAPRGELLKKIVYPRLRLLTPAEAIKTIQITTKASLDHAIGVYGMYQEIRSINGHLNPFDQEAVEDAMDFSLFAHGEQARDSGEPYIMHPLWTVNELAKRRVGRKGQQAAALHDVSEDTLYTVDDLRLLFGHDVATIVSGLQKTQTRNRRVRNAETLENVLVGLGQDLNVFLVKFWERFHNFRNIREVKSERGQRANARETLDIYVPLADEWGVEEADSIAETCLEILDPEFVGRARELTNKYRPRRIEKYIKQAEETFRTALGSYHHAPPVEVELKMPSVYRLYKRTGGHLSLLKRAIAPELHVQFPSKQDSLMAAANYMESGYSSSSDNALSDYVTGVRDAVEIVHGSWHGSLRLVITSAPERDRARNLLYRACNGETSTEDMPLIQAKQEGFRNRMSRLREQYTGSVDRMEALGEELGKPQIRVFTPDNKPIPLPEGANAIDFAYAVHAGLGRRASKVVDNTGRDYKLNEKIPNRATLRVEVTDDENPRMNIDRLGWATTAYAREHIRREIRAILKDPNGPDHEALNLEVITKGLQIISEDVTAQHILGKIPFTPNDGVIVRAVMEEGVNGKKGVLEYLEDVALGSVPERLLKGHRKEVLRRVDKILKWGLLNIPIVQDDIGIAAAVNELLANKYKLSIDDMRLTGLISAKNYFYRVICLGLVSMSPGACKEIIKEIQNLEELRGKIGSVSLGLQES